MADPVSISFSLQNLKCVVQCLKAYQQVTDDATNTALIASLSATLTANETATPPVGMASALAQSQNVT